MGILYEVAVGFLEEYQAHNLVVYSQVGFRLNSH